MTLLTIFYGFLDNFLQLYLFCFALYAVRSSSTQYKSLLPFLRGVWGRGGRGCVCKSYSMDSLLLSKRLVHFWLQRMRPLQGCHRFVKNNCRKKSRFSSFSKFQHSSNDLKYFERLSSKNITDLYTLFPSREKKNHLRCVPNENICSEKNWKNTQDFFLLDKIK
jgi:hypothetical protein